MDPTRRFSDRVAVYAKHRPTYPKEIIDLLKVQCGLEHGAVVADIGSGTGQLAKLFLAAGYMVIGVEPDPKMRQAGANILKPYPQFKSVAGRAESTNLANNSIDFIATAQAFHWFNPAQARSEFMRILKYNGWVVLVWNVMRTSATTFQKAYHNLLSTFGTDYENIRKAHADPEAIRSFFESSTVDVQTFANHQELNYEGLEGRLLSSSFTPNKGQPGHNEMLQALKTIFRDHRQQGKVTIEYDTKVFYGRIHL